MSYAGGYEADINVKLRRIWLKMILEKINMKEIKYYCTSSDIDFDCLPFGSQIKTIVSMFFYYDIKLFSVDDIKVFYEKMQIPSPRNNTIRKPSNTQIQKIIDKMNNIKNINENEYEILEADTKIYEMRIRQGYEKNRIK